MRDARVGRPRVPVERSARARLDRQITQLTRLVDDLLDITRISRGKIRLQRERIALNDLLRVAVEDHAATFRERGGRASLPPGGHGGVHRRGPDALRQIVDNLLQNAVKFTPRSGQTTVWLEADTARSEAVLRVHDTDASIAPEVLAHLFQPFVQADRTLDRSKGGLGLGFALVEGIVELHSGRVDVATDPDQGTAFTVRLPLAAPISAANAVPLPRSARAEPTTTPHAGARRRVLVIEDNQDAANSLRDALEIRGSSVAVAETGPDGIELARRFEPDAVICDIGLPTMSGYDVARTMRQDPKLHDVALVALSGYATPDDVQKSRDAGFDRHVSKPPSIDALDRLLADLVG